MQSASDDRPADEFVASAFSNRRLHLVLMPTEKCNFRCTYCYERFDQGRMSDDVVMGIKALTARRAMALESLRVSWFGGEPLLALDLIRDLSSHFLGLATTAPDMKYGADITTNGALLTTDVLHCLVEGGVRGFQITLDGDERGHNQSRLRADGSGTYDLVMQALLVLRESRYSDIEVLIRMHISPDNLNSISRLIPFLKDNFLHDGRFKFKLKAIEPLGGENDALLPKWSGDGKGIAIDSLSRLLYGTAPAPAPTGVSPGADACYAARPDSFVVRSTGRIGKCTVALYDDRNDIGRLSADGSLDLDQDKFRPWLAGFEDFDPGKLRCPLFTVFDGPRRFRLV